MVDVVSNLKRLREEIESLSIQCGRNPEHIRLLAVTKTVPADLVSLACTAPQLQFGENRVQEAASKIPLVTASNLEWHLIGPLQSNKAQAAVRIFDVIQTLDRPKIAHRVNQYAEKTGRIQSVFMQVNIGEEPQKHGVLPGDVLELMEIIDAMPHLDLGGLMTIPPHREDPTASRPHFRRMSRLLAELNSNRHEPLRELSMGMTHDFRVAIEEGSTLLRVGTAIFGKRRP